MPEARSRAVTTMDGLRLHIHVWDVDAPQGTVLVVHGLGEHGGRYGEVAAELNRRGLRVVAHDLRGHGLSEGPVTHTPTFDHFLDDLEQVERETCDRDLPLAIWGHSLGGLITVRYLQGRRTEARVAVVSAPWLGRPPGATWWKTGVGRVIGALWPAAPLPSGVEGVMLTHDTEKQAEYDSDPLVRKTVSPLLFAEGSQAVAAAFDDIGKLSAEVLFLVPLSDALVNAAETLKFAGMLPTERCSVWSRKEWRHEPHNELDHHTLVREIGDWLGLKLNT